jgi:hypothetical protein
MQRNTTGGGGGGNNDGILPVFISAMSTTAQQVRPLITNRCPHRSVKGPKHLPSNSPRQLLEPKMRLTNYESQPVRAALDWPDIQWQKLDQHTALLET